MKVQIEPMTRLDIPRCFYLEQLLFGADDPWPEMAFHSELAAAPTRYFTAWDSHVVGYAGIALLGTDQHPEAEIRTLGVDPRHQRRGIGTRLLDRLLCCAEERGGPVFLEVRADNEAAKALYVSRGFRVIGRRRNYYSRSRADAHTMCRPQPTTPAGQPSSETAPPDEGARPDEALS